MSTILSADDLNDFIAPGVACVKPVEIEKSQDSATIEIGIDGQPVEQGRALQPASISLQDCLACSGCITSSEAMLVELQSPKELLKTLKESPDHIFVASVSHQSRVSLAKAYDLSVAEMDSRLRTLLVEKLGFSYVLGTEIGRALALEESWSEALERKAEGGPILSSICPGWTCYAEKTHPEILGYLSGVRSPQQLTGQLAKRVISSETGVSPARIYHVSIMPCFDKKLEASRPEFALEDAREVDLVITARELVDMLRTEFDTDFNELPASSAPISVPQRWPSRDEWKSNAGSSSGGYLAYVLHRAITTHFEGAHVEVVPGKNSDYVEYQVVMPTGEIVYRGAQVYGFRNIQNLVRKLKMKQRTCKAGAVKSRRLNGASKSPSDPSSLDYVELMACPGGCVSGGGQMPAPENLPTKVWTVEMDAKYRTIEECDVTPEGVAGYLGQMGVSPSRQLLRAEYKPVERDESLPAALTVGTQW